MFDFSTYSTYSVTKLHIIYLITYNLLQKISIIANKWIK